MRLRAIDKENASGTPPVRVPGPFGRAAGRIARLFPRASGRKVLIDAILLASSYPLAYQLRTTGGLEVGSLKEVLLTTAVLVPIKLSLLAYFGQYRVMWRYSSVRELAGLVKAASLGIPTAFTLAGILRLFYSSSAVLIDWTLTILLLGGARFAARFVNEWSLQRRKRGLMGKAGAANRQSDGHPHRVLIYGAGDAGEMIAREATRPSRKLLYEPVGFIDDDRAKHGMSIHGLTVLGGRGMVGDIVRANRVDEIFITIPSARGEVVRELVRACEGSGAQLKIVPGLDEIVDGRVRIADVRNLIVDDLLGRERIDLNLPSISSYVSRKRVLVTGAGGSIGSELCRQIVQFQPSELTLLGRGENSIFGIHEELSLDNHGVVLRQIIGDVINKKKLAGVFRRYRPEIIFHAGADKHVPLMELNPDEAVLNNILGTQNLLEVAEEHRAEKVVCISTDKAVNPTSIMGCCKRVAELIVQQRNDRGTTAVAVRFGNVLGSRGSVIPIFQRQIERGGPVTVTDAQVRRFFMTIQEAAQLVIQAGALGAPADLFILDMGEPVKVVDLAKDMIRLAGFEPDVDIPIRITGLRPGEKIDEELVHADEICESTTHEKILRVRTTGQLSPEALDRAIKELVTLAVEMDFIGIVRKLQEVVPEFMPRDALRLVEKEAKRDASVSRAP